MSDMSDVKTEPATITVSGQEVRTTSDSFQFFKTKLVFLKIKFPFGLERPC